MHMRRTVVAVALATAATVPAVSVTAAQAVAKPAVAHAAATKSAKHAKPVRLAFAADGSVTAVNATNASVTVAVKSGTKDVKAQTITVSVPSATRIVVNDSRKTLSDLAVGYRMTVTGTHTGSLYTAVKIEAHGVPAQPAPSTGPSTDPLPSATPVVTDSPTTPETGDPNA